MVTKGKILNQPKGNSFGTNIPTTGAVPLTAITPGRSAIVSQIFGGRGRVQRLIDLGLVPGTRITVIRAAAFGGPIEILVRNTNLALGRGIASRIMVIPE